MDRNKTVYEYAFSNREIHKMTPIEAHKYAHKHKVDILSGPGYIHGRRDRFTGWGWHDTLKMSFRGPNHYRTYLRANGLYEADINDCPKETTLDKPVWTEELIRKAINEYGISIGGVMAEALLKGELDYPETPIEETPEDAEF